MIKDEVKTYDDYLKGEVYSYEISTQENEEQVIESCCGFFGYENDEDKWYVLQEAKRIVDFMVAKKVSMPTECHNA